MAWTVLNLGLLAGGWSMTDPEFRKIIVKEDNVPIGSINHAVMIVGWTPQGWIVRNSWGTDWGANGYILIAYGSNNIGYGAAWVEVDPK